MSYCPYTAGYFFIGDTVLVRYCYISSLEQIRVCTRIHEYQTQLAVILFPNEQPVGLHVALPTAFVLARQFVWAIIIG